MNGFAAFFKKEIVQSLRSGKTYILLAVFALFGMMSPALARFTPQILGMAGMGDMLQLPSPVALDSWAQFYSNMGQMGIIALLLIYGGIMSSEQSKGTLILPLTHGLGRTSLLLAKLLITLLGWTMAFVCAGLLNYLYSLYLFPGENVEFLIGGLACFWLCGVFLLSLIPLSSVLVKGSFGGLAIPGGVLVLMWVLMIFPDLFSFNPVLLTSMPLQIMAGAEEWSVLLPAIITSVVTGIVSVVAAVLLFRRSAL